MGIYLCTVAGELNRCECLADLAQAVGKDKLKEMISTGLDDWTDKIPRPGADRP
ncbi:hypothetical protein [Microbispora sp. H11081]|uniref:hypothetical protein n=1 Tax=Microbispora sp. H11081 TaxID=2729107 RepID=UPI0014730C16|nr:hypothetical protein [Microbispora sp. H11081]